MICFWYKKSADTLTETNTFVFVVCDNFNENELSVQFLGTSGRLDLSIGETVLQLCTTNCCDNVWHHVAIVYDSVLSAFFYYFNGILCCSPGESSL